jgi:hypothetical protein
MRVGQVNHSGRRGELVIHLISSRLLLVELYQLGVTDGRVFSKKFGGK